VVNPALIGGRTTIRHTEASIAAMDKRVFAATAPATKTAAQRVKTSIKGQMRGRPRWSHRGKWKGREEVNLPGPVRKTRAGSGGGPGKFSGQLQKSIRSSKKPRIKSFGNASSVVFASSKYNKAINAYASKTESRFPYFRSGVNKMVPKIPAIYAAAWAKATQPKVR
jgi:hypothetical protein